MNERVIKTIAFRDLPDQLKEKVVRTFRSWMNDVYKILAFKKDIAQMFDQLNCAIEFYVNAEGQKLFRVDDSDERMAKFLSDQFIIASKYDDKIMDKIITNMIKRNDGDQRLKI
jgi:hypothetical protein